MSPERKEGTQLQTRLSSLPEDVLWVVIGLLPLADLVHLRRVSRFWRDLVDTVVSVQEGCRCRSLPSLPSLSRFRRGEGVVGVGKEPTANRLYQIDRALWYGSTPRFYHYLATTTTTTIRGGGSGLGQQQQQQQQQQQSQFLPPTTKIWCCVRRPTAPPTQLAYLRGTPPSELRTVRDEQDQTALHWLSGGRTPVHPRVWAYIWTDEAWTAWSSHLVGVRDIFERDFLRLAVEEGHVDLVRSFLDSPRREAGGYGPYGAIPVDGAGRSLLHVAASRGRERGEEECGGGERGGEGNGDTEERNKATVVVTTPPTTTPPTTTTTTVTETTTTTTTTETMMDVLLAAFTEQQWRVPDKHGWSAWDVWEEKKRRRETLIRGHSRNALAFVIYNVDT